MKHLIGVSLITLSLAGGAFAQTQSPSQSKIPDKTHFLVSTPAGGTADTVTRKIAMLLQSKWGFQPIVENKAGASGTLGADFAVRSRADNPTILVTAASTLIIAPYVIDKMPFNPESDLVPVALIATTPFVLVVRADDSAKNLSEFLTRAKLKEGSVSFGSYGNGSAAHIVGAEIDRVAGVKMLHVPYKGPVASLNDLLGGRLTAVISDLGSARPFIADGRLRALAVTGGRHPSVPNVVTFGEQGLPELDPFISWFGAFAPTNMSTDLRRAIANDLSETIRSDIMKSDISKMGLDAAGTANEEFSLVFSQDKKRWSKVIDEMGGLERK